MNNAVAINARLRDGELDLLALGEGAEALRLDGRLVDEEVLAAVLGGDEAEALGVIEPLHGAALPRLRRHLARNPNRRRLLGLA